MSYLFSEVRKNVYLVRAIDQYNLGSMFIRLQEYYESPFENIKGKYFTLDEYMDTYAEANGAFTYFNDWSGFNIPCWAFEGFFKDFQHNLRAKEVLLLQEIRKLHLNKSLAEKFYIIGVVLNKSKIFNHEIAHAYWYMDYKYQKKMSKLIKEIPNHLYVSAEQNLISSGYDSNYRFIQDEIQAYLATSHRNFLIRFFGWGKYPKVRVPSKLKTFFKEYDSAHK